MKKCTKCNLKKELFEFYKRKSSKDGLLSHCKSCEKKYKKTRKNKIKETNRIYYIKNKDEIIVKNKKWANSNKDKLKIYFKERLRIKLKKEPLFKFKNNLRNRNWYAFKNKGYSKNSKTQEMLGVDWHIAKQHIEKQFTKGMNWDNYGEWHIDHIIPLSSANTKKELKNLCHYTNLQPLWAKENIIKKDKINGQQILLRI